MGVWGRVLYGVPNKGRLGSGVPHREPSVLHVIVEAVAGDLGASQASSQLPGEKGGADEGKSSCLTSRIGVCRGERETARDLHPEAWSVQPGEWRGLLEAGVQSSISSSGVTPCLRGVGGGCVPRGGGLAARSSGENMGGSSRSDSFSCSCACPSCCGRRVEVTWPRRRGDLRRPMSASVSACVFPTMPTCEGTCSQRTAAPACSISPRSCSHRSTWPTGPREPCQSWRRHLLALHVAPMTTSFESEQISVRLCCVLW